MSLHDSLGRGNENSESDKRDRFTLRSILPASPLEINGRVQGSETYVSGPKTAGFAIFGLRTTPSRKRVHHYSRRGPPLGGGAFREREVRVA
jgi:hypothetical protein